MRSLDVMLEEGTGEQLSLDIIHVFRGVATTRFDNTVYQTCNELAQAPVGQEEAADS